MFFNGLSPKKDKCCGCGGCSQICPKNAITMSTDDDGFIMPTVNTDLCIECGLCEKVCPIINGEKVVSREEPTCYGAINKNRSELMSSSSGGIFSVIAEYVLNKGGIIYGAAFDDNMQLSHIGIDRKEDLFKLRGSKYLQSNIKDVFIQIRNNLKEGRLVYFTGTGCQVAGLKCFLRKDFDNLICSDILCHGTPNQQVFDEVIKSLEHKYKGKVVGYDFRDKKINGWSCSSSSSSIERNGKVKYIGFDPIMQCYFNAFIKGADYRDVCYKCPFAQDRRSGDITLADFWGAENYLPLKDKRAGISAILVNTEKGKALLNEIKEDITLYDAKLDDIKVINKTLIAPTPKPKIRDSFFDKFKENPLSFLLSFNGNLKKAQILFQIKKTIKTNPILYKLLRLIRK